MVACYRALVVPNQGSQLSVPINAVTGKGKGVKPVKPMGRHILAEFLGCTPGALDDMKEVERTMVEAALQAGAEVREVAFHKFSPQGVSGVVIISESHLAIHTWPETNYASIDVFTCGDRVDPWDAYAYLKEKFGASDTSVTSIERGMYMSPAPQT